MPAEREHAVPSSLVADIRMSRTVHAGSFLVVEGKDDVRFWTTRSHQSCRLIVGNGKPNVVRGLQRLDEIEFAGALGVVDRNHEQLAGVPLPSPNLVATDAHDLECLLCRSPALDSVLVEFGKPDKLDRFKRENGVDVRKALLERGLVFGRLRWAARRGDWGIVLPAVREFVDGKSWAVDADRLMRKVADSADGMDEAALRRQVAQLPEADPWHVVRGHDLIELLRIGLRNKLGDLPTAVGVKGIASVLRQAMQAKDLRSTGMWRDMRQWEGANKPFLVLADGIDVTTNEQER